MPAPRDVEFASRDTRVPDLVLRAWWIPGEDEAGPTVILVHGRDSCRRDENILLPAGMLHRNGFGVLLMDQRDHGDSDDEDLRFAGGSEEYLDVLGAWDWLVAEGVPEEHIGILGMSFGAATTVIAGGEEPRSGRCGRTPRSATSRRRCASTSCSAATPRSSNPHAVVMARLTAGDDLTAKSPLGAIPAYAGRPLAIAHGTDDTTILVSHARSAPRAPPRRTASTSATTGSSTAAATRVPWSTSADGVRAPPGPVLHRALGAP